MLSALVLAATLTGQTAWQPQYSRPRPPMSYSAPRMHQVDRRRPPLELPVRTINPYSPFQPYRLYNLQWQSPAVTATRSSGR